MKLWIQTSGAIGADPAWEDYDRLLNAHFRQVARPGTEICLHGSRVYSPAIVTHQYPAHLHTSLVVEAALQAEREGYDAFVQTGSFDLGFLEIRELVEIPVVFPIETALHIATLLAPQVAFLTQNRPFLNRLNQRARAYGFGDRLTPGGWVDLTPRELQLAFKNPGPTIDLLAAEAKKIGEQGANVLICAGNMMTMLFVSQGTTEIEGVRILDSLGILVKMAEMMVDLHQTMGITRRRMGMYAPLPKEEIRSMRKLYGVE
ncbi:MAG: hypothetical protein HY675_22015 [Chloroflexi bacterium]|nr:hypothetical protein [Chloroflexota bacterium]